SSRPTTTGASKRPCASTAKRTWPRTSRTPRSATTKSAHAAAAEGCCPSRASREHEGGRAMQINDTLIDDTFAEAFPMKATRLVITAHTPRWARAAAQSLTGFATSVIDCGCEAGIERELGRGETPDGRPGISVLMFAISSKELAKQVMRRVG